MPAPESVANLVNHFRYNLVAFKAGTYNETQVRREFIDPMFEALGWDVNNKQMYTAAYKDVIHEDAIKIGGQQKPLIMGFGSGERGSSFLRRKSPR